MLTRLLPVTARLSTARQSTSPLGTAGASATRLSASPLGTAQASTTQLSASPPGTARPSATRLRAALLGATLLSAALLATAPASAAQPKVPRLANGKPDFSGIWQTTSAADYDLEPHGPRRDAPPSAGIVEGGTIPYLPAALEVRKKNFEARATNDPRLKCWTLGVPRGIYFPEPFQILQRERDLTIVHQFGNSVRTIHTNGTLHPREGDNGYWLGDSRAKWDGDTLVVDVVDFNDETWLDRAGNFHSDQLHVVERWKYLDENTIEYRATLADPKVYSKPWTLGVVLHRHREKNFQLIEDYCFTLEYDPYYPTPHTTGAPAPAAAPTAAVAAPK